MATRHPKQAPTASAPKRRPAPHKRDSERRVLPRFTDRLKLAGGLAVSPMCFGVTENWRLIPSAFDMGINFFFLTTDMHWPLYEANRKGLKALFARRKRIRDEVVIAGACYPTQIEFMVEPFRELAEAVPGMGHVDLLVAGGVYGADLLARTTALRRVATRIQGRAVGASFHDRQAALAASNHHLADLCYVRYSPIHSGARTDLFPQLCTSHVPLFNFKSTFGYRPRDELRALNLGAELWYPHLTDYYRYALSRPEMSGLLFSISRLRHLVELERALAKGGLTIEEEQHLEELAYRASAAGTAVTGKRRA